MGWKTGVIAGAVTTTAVIAAPPLILAGAGFGAAGVTAGSMAAAWQATIGNVAAGSLFAALQSAGTASAITGLSASVGTGVGTVVGAVTGALTKKKTPQESQPLIEGEGDGEEHNANEGVGNSGDREGDGMLCQDNSSVEMVLIQHREGDASVRSEVGAGRVQDQENRPDVGGEVGDEQKEEVEANPAEADDEQ